jgi:hypothetical protein
VGGWSDFRGHGGVGGLWFSGNCFGGRELRFRLVEIGGRTRGHMSSSAKEK